MDESSVEKMSPEELTQYLKSLRHATNVAARSLAQKVGTSTSAVPVESLRHPNEAEQELSEVAQSILSAIEKKATAKQLLGLMLYNSPGQQNLGGHAVRRYLEKMAANTALDQSLRDEITAAIKQMTVTNSTVPAYLDNLSASYTEANQRIRRQTAESNAYASSKINAFFDSSLMRRFKQTPAKKVDVRMVTANNKVVVATEVTDANVPSYISSFQLVGPDSDLLVPYFEFIDLSDLGPLPHAVFKAVTSQFSGTGTIEGQLERLKQVYQTFNANTAARAADHTVTFRGVDYHPKAEFKRDYFKTVTYDSSVFEELPRLPSLFEAYLEAKQYSFNRINRQSALGPPFGTIMGTDEAKFTAMLGLCDAIYTEASKESSSATSIRFNHPYGNTVYCKAKNEPGDGQADIVFVSPNTPDGDQVYNNIKKVRSYYVVSKAFTTPAQLVFSAVFGGEGLVAKACDDPKVLNRRIIPLAKFSPCGGGMDIFLRRCFGLKPYDRSQRCFAHYSDNMYACGRTVTPIDFKDHTYEPGTWVMVSLDASKMESSHTPSGTNVFVESFLSTVMDRQESPGAVAFAHYFKKVLAQTLCSVYGILGDVTFSIPYQPSGTPCTFVQNDFLMYSAVCAVEELFNAMSLEENEIHIPAIVEVCAAFGITIKVENVAQSADVDGSISTTFEPIVVDVLGFDAIPVPIPYHDAITFMPVLNVDRLGTMIAYTRHYPASDDQLNANRSMRMAVAYFLGGHLDRHTSSFCKVFLDNLAAMTPEEKASAAHSMGDPELTDMFDLDSSDPRLIFLYPSQRALKPFIPDADGVSHVRYALSPESGLPSTAPKDPDDPSWNYLDYIDGADPFKEEETGPQAERRSLWSLNAMVQKISELVKDGLIKSSFILIRNEKQSATGLDSKWYIKFTIPESLVARFAYRLLNSTTPNALELTQKSLEQFLRMNPARSNSYSDLKKVVAEMLVNSEISPSAAAKFDISQEDKAIARFTTHSRLTDSYIAKPSQLKPRQPQQEHAKNQPKPETSGGAPAEPAEPSVVASSFNYRNTYSAVVATCLAQLKSLLKDPAYETVPNSNLDQLCTLLNLKNPFPGMVLKNLAVGNREVKKNLIKNGASVQAFVTAAIYAAVKTIKTDLKLGMKGLIDPQILLAKKN